MQGLGPRVALPRLCNRSAMNQHQASTNCDILAHASSHLLPGQHRTTPLFIGCGKVMTSLLSYRIPVTIEDIVCGFSKLPTTKYAPAIRYSLYLCARTKTCQCLDRMEALWQMAGLRHGCRVGARHLRVLLAAFSLLTFLASYIYIHIYRALCLSLLPNVLSFWTP